MAGSTTNLDLISSSQASKEVTANALFDAGSPSTLYGRRASTSSALTWGFYGGMLDIAGTITSIANGTVALTASLTNYVVASRTTGAVSVSTATTNWNDSAGYIRLYSIIAGASTVTSYIDYRTTSQTQTVTTHIADEIDAHAASAITNTPAGTIASTNVQAAINELDTEKAGLALANAFTQPQTITANSASAALTVTQTGTGNSFVVEDAASPDSTPFVIDASGNVVIGNTSNVALNYASSPKLQVAGTSQSTSAISSIFSGISGAYSPSLLFGRSTGSIASPTAIISGDDIGRIQFDGYDGVSFVPAAVVLAEADGTPGVGSMPGRLVFSTTPSGSSTPVERMRITSAGNLLIGSTTDDGVNKLQVTGNIKTTQALIVGSPVTVTTATHTVAATTTYLICNYAGVETLTLPTASSNTGRSLRIKTITANTVISASANVVPLVGGAAGTAILSATAGKWAHLVSDGTNWIIMEAN